MSKQDFWVVFWPAWCKSMTTAVIQSGFRKTGIFPYNPGMIKHSALAPPAATDNITQIEGKDCCGFQITLCVWLFWIHFQMFWN